MSLLTSRAGSCLKCAKKGGLAPPFSSPPPPREVPFVNGTGIIFRAEPARARRETSRTGGERQRRGDLPLSARITAKKPQDSQKRRSATRVCDAEVPMTFWALALLADALCNYRIARVASRWCFLLPSYSVYVGTLWNRHALKKTKTSCFVRLDTNACASSSRALLVAKNAAVFPAT